MFRVRNKVIISSELEVIQTLQTELHKRGIIKLRKIKPLRNSIQVSCPVHTSKDGIIGGERRPSCGITVGDDAGVVNCFACSYGKERPIFIAEFISNCFGHNDRGRYGEQWLLDNFVIGITQVKEPIRLKIRGQVEEEISTYITEDELEKYRFTHDYVFKRGLTHELIYMFDIGFDNKVESITFPVYDLYGNCVFIARRSIDNKLFHYPPNAKDYLYGANFIIGKYNYLIVTEGIFDALSFWRVGKPAVALMGVGSKNQLKLLRDFPVKKIILCFDNDEAGINANGRFRDGLKGCRKLISEYNITGDKKDPADLTDAELLSLKEYY